MFAISITSPDLYTLRNPLLTTKHHLISCNVSLHSLCKSVIWVTPFEILSSLNRILIELSVGTDKAMERV